MLCIISLNIWYT